MRPVSPQLEEENRSLRNKVRELEGAVKNLELKVRVLELAKALAVKPDDDRQCFFDIKTSETVRIDVETEDGNEAADGEPEETPSIPSGGTRRGKKKRVTPAEKFAGLDVSGVTVIVPDEVKADPGKWKEIGEVTTFEVLVHPARLSRHNIVLKKFVPVGNRDAAPVMAKAPVRFSTSYVSSSLAVYVVLEKYLEHGSLHRLERRFARLGADIARQVQSDTVERFALWARPIYESIERKAKASDYLQIDETFIRYINGRAPGGGQGYFWAFQSPGQSMVFKWIDNRRHENVDRLISGFNGLLQSDGYAAYIRYAETRDGITLLACWAHAFRKFRDALGSEPKHAKSMMRLIRSLYDLEEQWDREGVSDSARLLLRAGKSKPIAAQIKAKLDEYAADMTIPPKGEFRDAVRYAANRWTALEECLNHGQTRLDTNLLESKFRPTKIGEKNWMFIGHPDAGEKSAAVYTLLNCCRIHAVNPQPYLLDVLEKLIPYDHRPPEELIEALLPENWIRANPEHLVKEPGQE